MAGGNSYIKFYHLFTICGTLPLMPKKFFFLIFIFLFFLLFSTKIVNAAGTGNCQISYTPTNLVINTPPLSTSIPEEQRWVAFTIIPSDRTATYKVTFYSGIFGLGSVIADNLAPDSTTGVLEHTGGGLPAIKYQSSALSVGKHTLTVEKNGIEGRYCEYQYEVKPDTSGGINSCQLNFDPPDPDETKTITMSGTIDGQLGKFSTLDTYAIKISPINKTVNIKIDQNNNIQPVNIGPFFPGDYSLVMQRVSFEQTTGAIINEDTNCTGVMKIAPQGQKGSIQQTGQGGQQTLKLSAFGGPTAPSAGISCPGGLETAIGCIPTDPTEFVKGFLKFAVAIAGGIALLIMVFGSFKMITSAGNPDSLKEGQEMFTNAIIGLLFIIFSTLLLKIIGVDILGLGKFLGF